MKFWLIVMRRLRRDKSQIYKNSELHYRFEIHTTTPICKALLYESACLQFGLMDSQFSFICLCVLDRESRRRQRNLPCHRKETICCGKAPNLQ